MAGVSECFNIGSVVACKTCYEKEIEGEVLAFDPQTKMLILSILYSNAESLFVCLHPVSIELGIIFDTSLFFKGVVRF